MFRIRTYLLNRTCLHRWYMNPRKFSSTLVWATMLQPEIGRELAFQIYVNHGTPTGKYQLIWFPRTGAHHDNNQYYRIVLAGAETPTTR